MSSNFRSDIRFIKLALELAKRQIGQTGANPSVGCVIVKKDRIIGRGVTGQGGQPHAEMEALTNAKESCKGATMFVTLEPCSHFGKTPPCVDKIIAAQISRIVCPLIDPDPRVSGTGFEKLKRANIEVDVIPIAREWAEDVARGFISRLVKDRPFVTVKLAMSIDGKIATESGDSKWITNKFARAHSHLLRVKNDAILVGTNTFLKDNPELTARGTFERYCNPLRIFLDQHLKIFPSDAILKNLTNSPAMIVCGINPNLNNLKIWRDSGVEILKVTSSDRGIKLTKLFENLAKKGLNSVLVEGGGTLVQSLLLARLIDELIVHRSGLILGSNGIPSVYEFEKMSQEIGVFPRMKLQSVNKYDDNIETIWKPEM